MAHITLELTEAEAACGVTLDAVADVLPRCAVFADAVWTPVVGPALAKAAARCALGADVEFVKLDGVAGKSGIAVYERAAR